MGVGSRDGGGRGKRASRKGASKAHAGKGAAGLAGCGEVPLVGPAGGGGGRGGVALGWPVHASLLASQPHASWDAGLHGYEYCGEAPPRLDGPILSGPKVDEYLASFESKKRKAADAQGQVTRDHVQQAWYQAGCADAASMHSPLHGRQECHDQLPLLPHVHRGGPAGDVHELESAAQDEMGAVNGCDCLTHIYTHPCTHAHSHCDSWGVRSQRL